MSETDGTTTSTRQQTDEFGFFVGSKDATPVLQKTPSSLLLVKSRESEWLKILDSWDSRVPFRKNRVKKLCREGIPDSLRPQVWMRLSKAYELRADGVFKDLCDQIPTLKDDTPAFESIDKDLHRCYPTHELFAERNGLGQTHLSQVLKSYALYNPKVGYCQGMGMIVGLMLMRMPPEDAFWLLVATTENYLSNYFSQHLSQLRQDALVFTELLSKHARPVSRHLNALGIEPLTYITQWFMPMYTVTLPWRTVLRVWDMFYCDGVKALHRVAIGLMAFSKDHLLRKCTTTSESLSFLVHIPKELISPDDLIKAALKIKIKKEDIKRLRGKNALDESMESL